MKQVAVLVCIVLVGYRVMAQEATPTARFSQLTVKDGLASPQVKKIYQDKTGFIWFCTANGLQRFDGKNFKTFYTHSQDTNCLPADDINDITEDKYGRYWIATIEKGVCIYDPKKEKFLRFNETNLPLFDQDGDNLVRIVFTPDGETALVTGHNGLYTFDTRTFACKRFRTDNSKLRENSLGGIVHVKDNLFLVAGRGFSLFDAGKNIFYDSSDAPVLKRLLSFCSGPAGGHSIAKDRYGKYWFSLWFPGFYCYDPVKESITEVQVGATPNKKNRFNNLVNGIVGDEKGNLYLSTYGAGVFYLETGTGKLSQRFVHDPADAGSLLSTYTSTIFMDRGETLWVATIEGISLLEPPKKFLFPVLNEQNRTYIATALLQSSDEHLWVGTYNGDGLFEFDKDFKLVKKYPRFNGISSFVENGIWDLKESRSGQIMICRQNGFSTIDRRTKKQDDYIDIPSLSQGSVTSVREDGLQRWWVGSWRARLVCFDPTIRRAKVYPTPGITFITAIDQDKLLLIVYEKGYKLYTFNTTDSSMHREPYHFFNPAYPGFTHDLNDIYDILIDKHLRYILSRRGLYILNNITGHTEHYTRSEGLPSSSMTSIVKDQSGHIWLGTAQGLSVFDTAAKTFRNFDQQDGLLNLEFQVRAMTQLKNGMILGGNTATVAGFYPDSLLSYIALPPPVITRVRIGNSDVALDEHHRLYKVSYKESNIAIDFASLDPARASSFSYAYQLKGFDKDWQYAGHATGANYTNLDGGKYSFIVKASGNGKDWVETKTPLSFFVSSPFYKQLWFICLIVVLILSILYAFYRIRIQRILEMQRLRNNISKDLHDDVGATMTSISILSEVASQKVRQQQHIEAHDMMEQIGSSSRSLLQNLDDIIWSINPQNDPIEKVVLRMKELASEMLEPNKIKYHLAFDSNLENIGIPMQDRRHLFLIYKEALHNMIKYASPVNAFLSMSASDHTLVMTIEDDGKGFDPGNHIAGNGLINMRQRAHQMNAKITIRSQPGKGSCIILHYPLK